MLYETKLTFNFRKQTIRGIGIVVETHMYVKSFGTSARIAFLLPEVYFRLQLLRKGRPFPRSCPGGRSDDPSKLGANEFYDQNRWVPSLLYYVVYPGS